MGELPAARGEKRQKIKRPELRLTNFGMTPLREMQKLCEVDEFAGRQTSNSEYQKAGQNWETPTDL